MDNSRVMYFVRADRLRNSVNGNPRWTLHLSTGCMADVVDDTFGTMSDASDNYEVSNLRRGDRVRLTFTRAGNVRTIENLTKR